MNALDLAQLPLWLGGVLLVMGRVTGLCLIAPVFSSTVVPPRVRVGLIVLLTMVLAPLAHGTVDPLTAPGMAAIAGQILVGAAVGFVLRLVFEAVALGGELVSQAMSLGFASIADPQTGASSTVLSQFYLLLVTLLFVVMDGHLRLIALLAEGMQSLPMDQVALTGNGLYAVVGFVAELFAGGVRVALPAMTSLLVVNIGFAAISRAAPSMNLFAVGFPITVSLGFVALWLSLRSLPGAFEAMLGNAWALMAQLLGA